MPDERPQIQKYLGRRFIQSCGVIALATALLVFHYIGEQTWLAAVTIAFGGYVWSNIKQDKVFVDGIRP